MSTDHCWISLTPAPNKILNLVRFNSSRFMVGTVSDIHLYDTKTNNWNLMKINEQINASSMCYDPILNKLLTISSNHSSSNSNMNIIDVTSATTKKCGVYEMYAPRIICVNSTFHILDGYGQNGNNHYIWDNDTDRLQHIHKFC